MYIIIFSNFSRMDEIKEAFKKYDADNSGSVSTAEAHSVLSKELGFSEESSRRLLKTYDRNFDGQLSYDEFIAFYQKVKEKYVMKTDLFFSRDFF